MWDKKREKKYGSKIGKDADREEMWRDEKAEDVRRKGVEEYKWEARRGAKRSENSGGKRGRKASWEDKEEREKETRWSRRLRDSVT